MVSTAYIHPISFDLNIFCIYIILSLLALALIERMRLAFIQTLFNPVASDSFGINERVASYLFLGQGIPKVLGSTLL